MFRSVVVILHSKTNRQTHVVNACRKTLSAVDFLNDGSHIATGEVSMSESILGKSGKAEIWHFKTFTSINYPIFVD